MGLSYAKKSESVGSEFSALCCSAGHSRKAVFVVDEDCRYYLSAVTEQNNPGYDSRIKYLELLIVNIRLVADIGGELKRTLQTVSMRVSVVTMQSVIVVDAVHCLELLFDTVTQCIRAKPIGLASDLAKRQYVHSDWG
ncbi:MAG: hypothetical protein ACJAUP_001543 [Cellvibrionaceae bacterium]|jgi:hypothetical protein